MRRPPHHTTLIAPLLWVPWLASCAAAGGAAGELQQPHPLVGRWYLTTQRPSERPVAGTRITLAVDSAGAGRFYGRLSSFFSGNVGIDPAIYRPFVGETSPADDTVRLIIEPVEATGQPLHFEGRLLGDSIAVSRLGIGADTVKTTGPLFFVRQRDR